MPTQLDVVRDALIELNVLAPHEDLQPKDFEVAQRALQRMLDTWRTQELLCFQIETVTVPISEAKPFMTVGPGGDVDRMRPVYLDRISAVQDPGAPNELEVHLEIIRTAQRWQSVVSKTVPSTWPNYVYVEMTMPQVRLTFWPVLQGQQLSARLYLPVSLDQFPDLTTNITFAPGYAEAIHYSLAVRCATLFGVPLTAELRDMAASRVADVKRTNIVPDEMTIDPALPGMNRGGSYDVYTDSYRP